MLNLNLGGQKAPKPQAWAWQKPGQMFSPGAKFRAGLEPLLPDTIHFRGKGEARVPSAFPNIREEAGAWQRQNRSQAVSPTALDRGPPAEAQTGQAALTFQGRAGARAGSALNGSP